MTLETMTNAPPAEVMWSISRIADRDKVAKPTVSIHVKRLVERHGLFVTRDRLGRVALVNVVQYDNLRARYADPSKAQAPARDDERERGDAPSTVRTTPTSSRTSYEEANRQKAWFDVEKRRLEAAELRGLLIRKDVYEASIGRCADELVRLIDLLPQEADAIAVELNFDDVHRVRIALKGMARRLRGNLSAAFATLASNAPAFDEPVLGLMDLQGGEG